MQNLRKEHLYKVLVIGDLGVGKTSIIRRYVHQTYSNNYRATIGVDFALKVLNWDSETVRLQLWDIAGGTVKDRFVVFYLQSAGFHLYDVTTSAYMLGNAYGFHTIYSLNVVLMYLYKTLQKRYCFAILS